MTQNQSKVAPVWPALPDTDATVEIAAQSATAGEPRSIAVYLRYPGGRLANVRPGTGLMLSLHNWGGTEFRNAPLPERFAVPFDVIGIGVDYYQSGDAPRSIPYDYGYLQAMDALRALYYLASQLDARGIAFDRRRLYATGGSGGGNLSQMVNKLAPRTFACVVDLSGMASLTPTAGTVYASAGYSTDPASPHFLTPAIQEIRDTANPAHLRLLKQWGNACQVVVIHGEDDGSCLATDKKRTVAAMREAGLEVEPHFIAKADVNGDPIRESGHQIGDRTTLLQHFAGRFLTPGSPALRRLPGPSDFQRLETLRYPVTGGTHVVSFAAGYPEISFVP